MRSISISLLLTIALALSGLAGFALSNESRVSKLENAMAAMEAGLSTPMAKDTRERFEALDRRISEALELAHGIDERLRQIGERLSRIEGAQPQRPSASAPTAPRQSQQPPELGAG